jgi:NAD(P)-dependent dehydrogenase (short-subunit alcohol dehydrogenase family)
MPHPTPAVSTVSAVAPLANPSRVVVVTGAARRLGRQIALTLAQHGWQVAVHYRHSALEAEQTVLACNALCSGAHAFQADLADEAAVRALIPSVVARMGRVDAVVNSASTFEHDDVHNFGFAAMETHWRSNTAAPIVLAQALHRAVTAQWAAQAVGGSDAAGAAGASALARRGVVVNLLDQKLWNPNPDFLSYTLSKAALEAANTLLAQALAPQVRVVGVAPGLTLTSHMLTDEAFAALHQLSPLGQSSTPHDVADAVRFVLDNGSITGTTLLVDGGQHLMRFDRDFSLMLQQKSGPGA